MRRFTATELHPSQKAMAKQILESDSFYHIVCTSRQWGKSFMLKQLLLAFAMNNPNSQVMFISMTLAQAGKIFKELKRAISGHGVILKSNSVENSIILTNGSEIYVRSYQFADAIRGYSIDYLIVDEAAFCKDDDWNACIRPTLATKGKKCVLCSTPRGYNFFQAMAAQGQDPYNDYVKYYKSTYRDNPYANMKEIDDARLRLPKKIFAAEYEAEFIAGGMSVFDNYRNCINIPVLTGKTVAAIDVGRQDDWTVLTVMSGRKVLSIERWRQDTWEHITANILKTLKKYGAYNVRIEVNGVGDVFYETLKKAIETNNINCKAEPFVTTNLSKNNIIERLINDFNTGNISITDNPDLLTELDNFEANYSKTTRAITYAGRNGMHDDMVMSLAMCNDLSQGKQKKGHYVFI